MKKNSCINFSILIVAFCISINSCTYRSADDIVTLSGYPEEVAAIINNKCATAGCHDNESREAAGGLSLSTWNNMFEGSRGGAVVIPFRPDYSTLCYYINTDSANGVMMQPVMPINNTPLSAAEFATIKNWITQGAPDKNNFVKFSDNQNKLKLYVANRGCDVVTVMDAESGLAIRYIDVGNNSAIEAPCMVKISPDKLHWYVIFNQGTTIEKYSTSDNLRVGELYIGSGIWSSFAITADSKKIFISDANFYGRIVYADLENMAVITTYQTGLKFPFNIFLNNANTKLYTTSNEGNYIYKIDIQNPLAPVIDTLSLEPGVIASSAPSLNPQSIQFNHDESKYFVTCNKSAELRIFQTMNDSLITILSTGSNPDAMAFSKSNLLLFVNCSGVPGTIKKSSVYVFSAATETFNLEIAAGHDSKGMVLDDKQKKLFVTNRNVSAGGPAAHHASLCEGKNGYITAIDISTMQLVPDFKAELSVDPYFISSN